MANKSRRRPKQPRKTVEYALAFAKDSSITPRVHLASTTLASALSAWRSWTALTWAALSGHIDVVQFLIEHNANVNAKGECQAPPNFLMPWPLIYQLPDVCLTSHNLPL